MGIVGAFLMIAAGAGLDVLPQDPAPGLMMRTYLNGLASAALAERSKARDALVEPAAIEAYQQSLRAYFLEQLGPLPERTPLNAHVVGQGEGDGYRYEKVLFESRPNFHVTAVLFLPKKQGPFPGVLVPCGHSANGKAYESYQRACILLARNGLAAFIYDPIGQGERLQFPEKDGKTSPGSTTEHMLTGVGCILLGANTAAYRIWDGMRALDYLTSRPDIDSTRIGCTGNSGGGTLTSYLMALDPRIVCAAPGCYLTSFARLLEEAGPQDAEQNIFGQIAHGMDHADYIMMRAPKPTLMLTATEDFFDIRGAWDSYRDAKRLYTKLGFPERVDLVEANEKHGFTKPLRTAMVRWMRRWLLGVDDAITEPDFPVLPDEAMWCTPKGQVLLLAGERSVTDLNIERGRQLAKERRALWKTSDKAALIEKIRLIAGIRPLAELPEPQIEIVAQAAPPAEPQKLILHPEPGIGLPALLFAPEAPARDAYLYVHGEGKQVDAVADGPIMRLVRAGHAVMAVDLRGIGETLSPVDNKDWAVRFATGWQDFFRAYLLGKSYVGMRTEDILVCARHLVNMNGRKRPVHLVAIGETGPAALHAAAMEPTLFASLRLERSIRSWSDVVRNPEAKGQLMNAVHGALRIYDLPDLMRLIAPVTVAVKDPLDFH